MLVQVSPSLNIYDTLAYNFRGDPALLKPGLRVVVPLNNRLTLAWVTETRSDYKGRVKDIIAVVRDEYGQYRPDTRYLEFTRAVSRLYFASMGTLLDASLPPKYKPIGSLYFKNPAKEDKEERFSRYPLAQILHWSKNGSIECFYKHKEAKTPGSESLREPGSSPAAGTFSVPSADAHTDTPDHLFLISYAREPYYLQRIRESQANGHSVLVTVPDNLTAAYLKEIFRRGGIEADLYNSTLTPKDRDSLWHDYAVTGKTGVVIGGLSAVLLPIRNLGLIICEASGSSIYKRPYFSPYNVQVLSQLRAQYFHIPLVEGYSSPTVGAIQNSTRVFLRDERETKIPVNVLPIKKDTRGIPGEIQEMVSNYLAEEKKILVLLNRKEGVNFLYCEKCQKPQKCPSCDGYMDIEGEEDFHVTCRRCQKEIEHHNQCPKCEGPLSLIEDISVSAMKKFLKDRVMEADITSISSEALKEEHIHTVLGRVNASRVVIATPVVVNPFFKNLFEAVVYLRPESFFNLDKYDAAEKVFSLVSELREIVKSGGSIDVFSTFHFHYALRLIDDEPGFFEREIKYREWFHLPPFFNVYHIEVRGTELRKLAAAMRKIYQEFKEPFKIKKKGVYLADRKASKGKYKYRGILEAHVKPEGIIESGLLGNRDITIRLEMA